MELRERSTKGIIEGDHIRLLEPVALEDGTLVELTITVPNRGKDKDTITRDGTDQDSRTASATPSAKKTAGAVPEARERQRRLLRKGIHLGGPPYPNLEELYER